jgi:hypothetical protein
METSNRDFLPEELLGRATSKCCKLLSGKKCQTLVALDKIPKN